MIAVIVILGILLLAAITVIVLVFAAPQLFRKKLPGESCSVDDEDGTNNCGNGLQCVPDLTEGAGEDDMVCQIPGGDELNETNCASFCPAAPELNETTCASFCPAVPLSSNSDSSCCPPGYNRDYLFAVHNAAECDKDTKRCQKCIGRTKAPTDWNNKVTTFSGGIYVTPSNCPV